MFCKPWWSIAWNVLLSPRCLSVYPAHIAAIHSLSIILLHFQTSSPHLYLLKTFSVMYFCIIKNRHNFLWASTTHRLFFMSTQCMPACRASSLFCSMLVICLFITFFLWDFKPFESGGHLDINASYSALQVINTQKNSCCITHLQKICQSCMFNWCNR